jgi:glycosyltransferase involved in cell wall biosynthesis
LSSKTDSSQLLKRPMKILIVSFTFPPNRDGVSDAASAMTRGFLLCGWKLSVLTRRLSTPRTAFSWNDVDLTEYECGGTKYAPKVIPFAESGSYEAYLGSKAWDAIIFHSYDASLFCALPHLNHLAGRKILVSHGYGALIWEKSPRFPYGLYGVLRRFLKSISMMFWMRRFDRIVYLSEQADFLGFYDHFIAKATGYKGRRVIPNGVDLAERGASNSDFRRTHGIPDGAFMLLCVANYSPRKDQAYGARAFRRAAVRGSFLVFIGSEFNEFSLKFQEEDTKDFGSSAPGNIIWLEKQTRESTLNAYAACDAFLLSAYHEAQPISLLEAMRESKPWIARKAGCIARMEGGLCVKSENEMAFAIQRLADDPSLCKRLGQDGSHAVATRYNRQAYIESYRQLVEELVLSDL